MDGLSALSIAASVAQFLEFGCSLVSKSKEIYRSVEGTLPDNINAEETTKRLIKLSEGIKSGLTLRSQDPLLASKEDDTLREICDGCIAASNTLLSKLEKLKVQDGQKMRRYKSIRQALKSVWSQKSLDELAEQLQHFRNEMDGHVLVSLSAKFNDLSILQDEKFTALDKALQRTIEPLLGNLIDIHVKLESMSSERKACPFTGGKRKRARISKSPDSADGENEGRDQKINAALLYALDYSARTHRQQEIAEAHQQTFKWIFNHQHVEGQGYPTLSHEARPWSNFIEWLRGEGNSTRVYWVNGKAGSGKSTLMRFIANHEETERHLKHWAGDADLQVSSFYFWNSGTGLQHSRQGFLRYLLLSTLRERPELTRKLFSAEWREMVEKEARYGFINQREWDIPLRRLEQVFNHLIELATDEFRICFFIDGLDESKDGPEELLDLINVAAGSPFVKICLSSRPWLVFEEAFANLSSLRLQDLTYQDIQSYVREKLQRDPKMERLEGVNPEGATSLVRNIVTKANGVFLWVRIVTKSLLDGLRNWDDISDLQLRLDELPSDLTALYSHMLDRIEPFYFFQASKIFRILDAASAIHLRPTILELDLAVNANYSAATAPTLLAPSDSELEYRCQRMTAHLKSRCEGLLEAHDVFDRHWESLPEDEILQQTCVGSGCGENREARDALGKRLRASWKVSYLHRTVKDFLNTPSVQARLDAASDKESSSEDSFDSYFSLLMSYVINLKLGLRSYYYDDEILEDVKIQKTTRDVIKIAGKIDPLNKKVLPMLRTFHTLSSQWMADPAIPATLMSSIKRTSADWDDEFMALAIYHGLWTFIEESMQSPTWLSGRKEWPPPLRLALGFRPTSKHLQAMLPSEIYRLTPAMVNTLLSCGANPNALIAVGQSIWQEFLEQVSSGTLQLKTGSNDYTKCFEIIRSMLEYGAEIGSGRRGDSEFWGSVSIDTVIDNIFSSRIPEEADLLRTIVQQKRQSTKRKASQAESLPSRKRRGMIKDDL